MNLYIETCKAQLKDIGGGRKVLEKHRCDILESIQKRIKEAQEIIICGMSPIGKRCLKYINSYSSASVSIWDIRNIKNTAGGVKIRRQRGFVPILYVPGKKR